MHEQLLYKASLEKVLISALRDEGIDVNVRTAIEISQVIAAADLTGEPVFSSLKFKLSPLISRNKEEQETVHKLFDALDGNIKAGKITIPPPPKPPEIFSKPRSFNKLKEKFINLSRWKKIAALFLLVAAIGFLLYKTIIPPTPIEPALNATIPDAVKNEPATFRAFIDSSLKKKYSVNWKFQDTLIKNSWEITRMFTTEGPQPLIAYLQKNNGKVVDSNIISFDVKCERGPSLRIDNITDSLRQARNLSKKIVAYRADFTNLREKTSFRYQWYLNDHPKDTGLIYTHERNADDNNTIRLVAYDYNDSYCSVDSLDAEYNEVENISAAVTGSNPLSITNPVNWRNVFLSLLFLLAIPLLSARMIYFLLSQKRLPSKKRKEPVVTGAEEGPYAIEFASQDNLITTQPDMKMLADTLRKRQVSDVFKLNMRRTINATIRSGGMPQLTYVPLTKPTDFLVLIDKEKRDILLTRLYEYLITRLQKEQVYITVYEYEKEPLLLSNQKLNHQNLPIDRLIALYPGTTLFIFGDSRHFVSSLKGKLKQWVVPKFSAWETKLFITSSAKQDWDKKESLLADAGFIIIPADLSAQSAIELVINKQADKESQDKLKIPEEYGSRYISLQTLNELKVYLKDENMVTWLCSLAVYPAIDWNFTIAAGKAIEIRMQQTNKQAELVTYTNLLKLARISWMRDGIITDTLRTEMLNHLDNKTEALARQTLMDQLNLLNNSINSNSLIRKTYEVNKKINALLLNAYQGKRISAEDRDAIAGIIDQSQLNIADEIYLNSGDNTLLKHPYHKRSVKLKSYIRLLSLREKLVFGAMAVASFGILWLLSWSFVKKESDILQWRKDKLYDQAFRISNLNPAPLALNASLKTKDSIYNFDLHNNRPDTVNVRISDTSETGELTLSLPTGTVIHNSSIKLNSSLYSIDIIKPIQTNIFIYYNSNDDLPIVQKIRQALPGNFKDSIIEAPAEDTGFHIYFTDAFEDAAMLADTNITQSTGLNLDVSPLSNRLYNTPSLVLPGVYIYIHTPNVCTPVALASIPRSLFEIWKGGTSNRLLNIDLSKQLIYYSTGDRNSYGTYRIDEVCLLKSGVLKFTTRANEQFKVFFLRNISATTFELSACQSLYKTKEEIAGINESYCDRFNRMVLYYESDDTRIFLPVTGSTLDPTQRVKLQKFANTQVDKVTVEINSSYIPLISEATVNTILKNSGISYDPGGAFQRQTSPGVFDRHYLTITPKRNVEPPDPPRCDIFFYSIDETRKLSPNLICKLDLSKQDLTSMPKEIEGFINLQELNLGETKIPEAQINDLRKKLPKCNIRYSIKPPDPPPYTERKLGTVNMKGGRPDNTGQKLVQMIITQLKSNSSASIRIEGNYFTNSQQKQISSDIQSLKKIFADNGIIEKSGQISSILINRSARVNPQTQKSLKMFLGGESAYIEIIGINFR